MCRTGGRRCPSSRSSDGGTRGQRNDASAGQRGDTSPPDDTGTDDTLARGPSVINYAAPTASVGGQYEDVHMGGITLGPAGVVITGPVTGTPSAPLTPGQAAAAESAAARTMAAAEDAAQAARSATRDPAGGDTVAVVGDGDVIAFQIGGRNYRLDHPEETP